MRRFSTAKRCSRAIKELSYRKGSYKSGSTSVAPPCVRRMSPRFSRRARSRRILGADEPATARISSMLAVPVLSRNLSICSDRRLSVSGMSHLILSDRRRELDDSSANVQGKLTKSQENFRSVDQIGEL